MSKKDRIDPPYFKVCEECGKHGRVIIPGSGQSYGYSAEIVTQAEGMEWSQEAVKLETIKKEDFLVLQRQVKLSTLPENNPDSIVETCNTYGNGYFDDLVLEVFEKIPTAKCHFGNATPH